MKILVKIGVLLLMIALLTAAFILPKFVQRTEPPMPEQDLAAALAAVEVEEKTPEPEADADAEKTNPLREDPRLTAFFTALDEENFVASSDELVRLSPDLAPELVDELTIEMEEAVASLGDIEMPELVALDSEPADSPALPAESSKAQGEVPSSTPGEAPAATPEETPAVEPAAVLAYFALVQAGDFETAEDKLRSLETAADPDMLASMKAALSGAKERENALAASQEELKRSQEEMARLQKESVTQIQESVKQLAEITEAAQKATEEASRLKTELAEVETAEPEPEKVAPEPPRLPETRSIAFGFDSTFLNDASKDLLAADVVAPLQEETRIAVQLRGHADSKGPSDYNGILARARCEVVKDFLLEQGIPADRIDIVSFGETQAAASGGSDGDLRRVDIIFRAN